MKQKIIYLGLAMLLSSSIFGQYGVRLKYFTQSGDLFESTENIIQSTESIHANGYEVGVDYWLKPFDKRIEFTPELAFGLSNFDNSEVQLSNSNWSALLNTRFYPMDMESDCDCPTFSKDGTFISKGFYFEISPGVSFVNNKIATSEWPSERPNFEESHSNITYRLGIGAGLDIGVSNFLTINPFITYNILGNNELLNVVQSADPNIDITQIEGDTKQLYFGLRFSFRPNYDPFRR